MFACFTCIANFWMKRLLFVCACTSPNIYFYILCIYVKSLPPIVCLAPISHNDTYVRTWKVSDYALNYWKNVFAPPGMRHRQCISNNHAQQQLLLLLLLLWILGYTYIQCTLSICTLWYEAFSCWTTSWAFNSFIQSEYTLHVLVVVVYNTKIRSHQNRNIP